MRPVSANVVTTASHLKTFKKAGITFKLPIICAAKGCTPLSEVASGVLCIKQQQSF